MRRFLTAAILGGMLCLAAPASAAPLPGPPPFPSFFQGPVQYQIITSAMGTANVSMTYTGTWCAAGCTGLIGALAGQAPQMFIGAWNPNAAAQVGNLTCFDNLNAASGTQFVIPALGGGQSWTSPGGGFSLTGGITCNMSAAANGVGVWVFFR